MKLGKYDLISGDDFVLTISATSDLGVVTPITEDLRLRIGTPKGVTLHEFVGVHNVDGSVTMVAPSAVTKTYTGMVIYEVAIVNTTTSETIIDLGDITIITGVN